MRKKRDLCVPGPELDTLPQRLWGDVKVPGASCADGCARLFPPEKVIIDIPRIFAVSALLANAVVLVFCESHTSFQSSVFRVCSIPPRFLVVGHLVLYFFRESSVLYRSLHGRYRSRRSRSWRYVQAADVVR